MEWLRPSAFRASFGILMSMAVWVAVLSSDPVPTVTQAHNEHGIAAWDGTILTNLALKEPEKVIHALPVLLPPLQEVQALRSDRQPIRTFQDPENSIEQTPLYVLFHCWRDDIAA